MKVKLTLLSFVVGMLSLTGFSQIGGTFSASITPKGRGDFDFDTISLGNNKSVNIEDIIINKKELTLINDEFQPNNFVKNMLGYVNVSPNPFINTLTIKNSDEPTVLFSIKIIDMQGRIVYERENINQSEINLSGLEDGIYLLNYSSVNTNGTEKIIIQKL